MSELINNRQHRIDDLKAIILHLHRGESPDTVRQRLADIVRETDATEVAAMEQQLMADGMTVDEVRSMCDLHAQVLRDVVRPIQIRAPLAAGHPVDTFRRENQAITEAVAAARAAFARVLALAEQAPLPEDVAHACRGRVNALFDIERHYRRKEDLLFPFLEKHGITGPSKVMWAKDDEVRALVHALADAIQSVPATAGPWRQVWHAAGGPALSAVEEMVSKEELILLPMALDTLTKEEWGVIWTESPRIGWCLVEPREGYRPPEGSTPANPLSVPGHRAIVLPTGHASLQQLEAVFATLPVDLTFVDHEDRVAFYTEGPQRIFARSKAIIGRKVQHCHPPRSVDVVDRILDDFRSGRQDAAEFWIDVHQRFVHIRYFAVRDAAGAYLGCLEMTQDVTAIRALEGERRLLQYEAKPAATGEGPTADAAPPAAAPVATPTPAPAAARPAGEPVWYREEAVLVRIDADAMLAQGVHPLQRVTEAAQQLSGEQLVCIESGFLPAPLIDAFRARGFAVASYQSSPGRFRTCIRRKTRGE
jgi:DUF438 domain-containing protein